MAPHEVGLTPVGPQVPDPAQDAAAWGYTVITFTHQDRAMIWDRIITGIVRILMVGGPQNM